MQRHILWRSIAPLAMMLSLQACKKPETGHCNDGKDNDKNELVDCDDPACAADPLCQGQVDEVCDDTADNDGDGTIDCADTDCAGDPSCGDSCDNAAALGVGVDVTADTTGAPDTQQGSCTGTGAGEDFYVFKPSTEQVGKTFTLSLTSDADMGLYTRSACDDTLTELDCTDSEFGAAAVETLVISVTDESPIFIFVDGFDVGEEGPYTLTFEENVPSVKCTTPTALALGDTVSGDTTTATDEFFGSCTGDGAGEDVYLVTPSAADVGKLVQFVLTSTADMGLYIRSTCDLDATESECIDATGQGERLTITITDTTPFSIFVDGFFGGEVGPYTLSSQIVDLAAICAAATPIGPGPISGDNTTAGAFFAGSCVFGDGPEDIFAFNVDAADVGKTLQLTLDSNASGADLSLYARADCQNEGTELGCSDNFFDTTESLSLDIAAAGTISIFVDGGFFGDTGAYTLNARVIDVPALCAAAASNVAIIGDNSGDTTDNTEDNFSGSCVGVNGLEDLLFFTPDIADVGGTLRVTLTSGADLGLYLRSNCTSNNAELACADNTFGSGDEVIITPVVDQNPLAIFVDSNSATELGAYNLLIEVLPPEDVCDDQLDNDLDGFLDCEDTTNCQASAACTPGATALGQPCSANNECVATGNDPLCFTESLNGFPSGYCSEFCTTDAECGTGNFCLLLLNSVNGQCFDECNPANGASDCQPGYTCLDAFGDGTTNLCFPGCTDDSQCTVTGHCDVDPTSLNQGFCTFIEDCTNGVDDDLDGLFDCEDTANDTTCTQDPTCQSAISDVCSAAIAIDPLTPTLGGDTSAFTTDAGLFVGSCIGNGTPQQIASFNPGTTGTGLLTITLSSTTDHAVYVRSSCVDSSTELGCVDAQPANVDETLIVPIVDASQPVSIFVEAVTNNDIGPFTLSLVFTPDVCGDGAITGAEVCDDNNTNITDGCDANCQIEPNFVCVGEPSVCTDLSAVCTGAPTANPGANPGDTTNGSNLFEGSCTGADSLEQLFLFTPSGNALSLTLASATDQGIYVRTACTDDTTELDCVDAEFGGTDEQLNLTVTPGVPLFIFVDGFFDIAEAGPFTLTVQ